MKKVIFLLVTLIIGINIFAGVNPAITYKKIKAPGGSYSTVSWNGTYTINMSLNDYFYIKVGVRNNGLSSSPAGYNNITMSFPQYTSSTDKNRIYNQSGTSSDINYNEYHGTVGGGDGYANYVFVEGSDINGWSCCATETNYLEVKVKPKQYGYFYVYVRAGMSSTNSWTNGWDAEPSSSSYYDCIGLPSYRFRVYVQPPQVDLIIINPNTNISSVVAGNSITASCAVKNIGSGSAGSSTLKYYLSQNTTYESQYDAYLDYDNVNSLTSGSSDSESEPLFIAGSYTPGTYYILFRADANNDVAETNENNNVGYKQITILSANSPPNNPSFILAPTTNLFPTKQFTVVADYTDPDGRNDIKNVYLRLAQNNNEANNTITIMWQNLSGNPTQWAGETSCLYSASATKTSITNGYRITWNITLKWNWVQSSDIDFWTWTYDYNSTESPSHVKITRNLDYINELVVYNSSVNSTTIQCGNPVNLECRLKFKSTTNTEPDNYSNLFVKLRKNSSTGTQLSSVTANAINKKFNFTWNSSVSDIGTVNLYLVPYNINNTAQAVNSNLYYDIHTINIETNTQFDGSDFVNKTAKYGIPLLLKARLETKTGTGITNKNISFEIKINNVWQSIANDGKSYSSLTTSNTLLPSGDGYGGNFYIAPTSLPQGNYPIKVKFIGDATNGPCEKTAVLNIHKPKWAFLIYLCGDNNLEAAACSDFYNEIMQSKDNNNVSVFVLFDRSAGSNILNGYSISNGNWSDTRLFKVSNSSDCYYDNMNELDMGSSTTFYNFVDASLLNLEADNYALVLWDHGNGIANLSAFIPQQQNKGICIDETSSSILRTYNIRQKLNLYNTNYQSSFKFQILALDACVMGMSEVLYELKDNTDLFLASEQLEGSDGLEYQNILTASNLSATSTKYQVANKMTNAISNSGSTYYTYGCWETSGITNLSSKISELSNYLLGNMYIPSFKQNITTSFSNSEKFKAFSNQPTFYIDLLNFCNQLKLYNDVTLQSKCNQITQILTSTTFRKYWNTNSTQGVGGLSMFFPVSTFTSTSLFMDYTGNLNGTGAGTSFLFTQNTTQKWDNFLIGYFDSYLPTCTISNISNNWYKQNISVSAQAQDQMNGVILFVEFQYSTDNNNWYPLPGPDSPDGKDWFGTNGYGLTFKITNTPQHGNINDPTVWIRSRACDQGGNYSAWSTSSSFGIDQITPTLGSSASSPNPSPGTVNLVQPITDNTGGSGVQTTNSPVFYIGWNNSSLNENNYDQQIIGLPFPVTSNNYSVSLNVTESHEGDVLYWRVKTEDIAGNSVLSAIYNAGTILDDDILAPTISNMVDPGPSIPGSYNFSATIVDPSGVKTSSGFPKLYYRYNNSSIDAQNNDGSFQMLNSTSNTYLVTINTPSSHIGDILYWCIYAEDNDNSPMGGYSTVQSAGMIMPYALVANAGQNTSICVGNTINLNATLTGGLAPFSYQWSPSIGLSNAGINNPIASPIISTTYTVTITDALTTSNTSSVTITVNPLPQVSLSSYSAVCLNTQSFTLNTGTPIGGNYTGIGVSNGVFDPSTAGVGSHVITYSFTNSNGCQASATQNLIVNQLPNVSLSSFNALCENSLSITLSGGTPLNGVYSGNGVVNNTFNPSSSGAGNHTITYSFTDNNGCQNTDTKSITVNSIPSVTLSTLSPLCVNNSAYTLIGGLPIGGIYSGNSIANGIFNPAVAGVGNHIITYTYTDNNNCQSSDNKLLEVKPLPNVSLTSFPSVCLNDNSFNLSGGNPSGGIYSGTGVINGVFYPTIAGIGSHTISYTFSDIYGCQSTISKLQIVKQLPIVNLPNITPVCLNDNSIILTNGSPTGGSYFVNGLPNSIIDPSLIGVGSHEIIYSYTGGNGCANSDTTSVQVKTIPNVSTGSNFTVNYSNDTTLTAIAVGGSSSYTYLWSPCSLILNSQCSTQNVTTIGLIITSDFIAQITDINNNCSGYDTVTVNIIGGPLQLSVGSINDTICSGDSTTLSSIVSGGSGNYSYNWSTLNGGTFSNQASPFVKPSINTTYYLVITDGSLTINDSVIIYVENLPNVVISSFPIICDNSNSLALTQGNPIGGNYSGNGIINGVFYPQQAGVGSHQIIYTYQNTQSCLNKDTQNITVYQKPNILFSLPTGYCSSASHLDLSPYTNPVGGQVYGDGIYNGLFIPDSANLGVNIISYRYQDSIGCADTIQKPIVLYSPPTVVVINDTIIPQNTSINLFSNISGGTGYYTYSWQPSSLVVNPTLSISNTVSLQNSTIFSLQVSDTLSGCIVSDSLIVTISGGNLLVDAFISKDTACQGEPIVLNCLGSGGSGYYNYNWLNSQGNLLSNQKSFVLTTYSDTIFFIEVTDGSSLVDDSVNLLLKQIPLLNLIGDTILCAGNNLTLDAGLGSINYQWSTGDLTSSIFIDTNTIGGLGQHNIWVVIEGQNGCYNTDSVIVEFIDCTSIKESSKENIIIYPNPTSGKITLSQLNPNMDYLIEIRNLLGQKVFYKTLKGSANSSYQIDISTFKNGVYILYLHNSNNEVFTGKIIKN